jgi:hypothetical protein
LYDGYSFKEKGKSMKKMILVAVLFCFMAGFVVPAQAIEVDFSGSLQFEGILNSSERMLDEDRTSDFRQMRLRVQTEFTITDDLKLITRFDALEKVLSSKDSAFESTNVSTGWYTDQDQENIDFDRAYFSWKSPIGLFEVGRMMGVVWGTSFCDDESDTDRIKYVLPVSLGEGKLYIGLVAEKVTENDMGPDLSDLDNDKYYLGATYVAKNYKTGILSAFYNFKQFQDPGQSFATANFGSAYADNSNTQDFKNFVATTDGESNSLASYGNWYTKGAEAYKDAYVGALMGGATPADAQMAAGGAAVGAAGADWLSSGVDSASAVAFSERGKTMQAKVFLLAPYFEGKFGNFSLTTELDYAFGTAEYDVAGAKDRDLEAFAYFVEGGYDLGPATFQLGFAHSKGDADYTDDKIESMGYVSPGVDWRKLLILHDDVTGMNETLANGIGNHVGGGFASASTAMCDGYQVLYAGVDYAVTDTISLGLIAGMAKADEVPTGLKYDDDQGVEYDASFIWNLTKNLQYKAVAAYLDGGDYWNTRATGVYDNDIDPDIYTLYHKLTLTF